MTPSPLVGALERIRPHDHLCSIYERQEDRFAVAVPFMQAGLERGEKCFYVGDDGTEEVIRRQLEAGGVDVEHALEIKALVLMGPEQAYLRHGAFCPDRMLGFWREAATSAAAEGFASLRVAAETEWAQKGGQGLERWIEYESRLTETLLECNCAALCQYNRRLYPSEIFLDVIHTHPLVVFDGAMCANHYHVPPDEFLRAHPVDRELERLLGSLRDRERAKEKLREANARIELVLNSITDHFFAFSKDWRFTYMNKHAETQLRQLGKDPVQIIGKVMWDEFPVVPNEAVIRRAMSERVPVVDELYYPPLGEWVENHIYPSENGGVVFFQRYVTERKRSEEALRRSEAQLAEAQKISRTGSWSWTAGSGEIFWSAEHFRIWGLDPAQAQPSAAHVVGMIHPEDQPRAQHSWDQALGEKKDFDCEFRIVRPDGTLRHVHSLGRPVLDAMGALVEYVGAVVDLTERKNAEEALRTTREKLERVNRTMTVGELAVSIAHELNQPLAAVVANANACERWLAAERPDHKEVYGALRRIVRDANRASDVIGRIRALVSGVGFEKSELRIAEAISDVVSFVEGEARGKGVVLAACIDDDLPVVHADRVQIQQVVLNLLVNAFDAMSSVEGPRTLEVRAGRDTSGVVLSVKDSGTGLDPRHMGRVFDAFFSTKREGMGMGLAISRSIVEAHGGRMWATNNDGPGATFKFTLPAVVAPAVYLG